VHIDEKFSCFMIGSESHLIQCTEILLQRGHQICGIISSETSITNWAKDKEIPHVEPGPDLVSVLCRQPFDYFFSIVYLSVIPNEILALPRKCAINFHDGPLPRYAGLNATSWALINREKTHAVTWHIMSAEVDKGDILKQRSVDIIEGDTAFTLNAKCYEACIDSFAELVDELASGPVESRKQNLAEQTYFSKYKRPPAACTLSWGQSADEIAALVRALDFGPYTNPLGLPKIIMGNEVFIVPEIAVFNGTSEVAPGTIIAIENDSLKVATASNIVALGKLLTINGQPLSIADFVARFGVREGDRLAELDQETADHLTTLNSAICRHEAFWLNSLAKLEPVELPYSNHSLALTGPVQYATVPMPIPSAVNTFLAGHDDVASRSELLVAAFTTYLARISGNYNFDLAFSHPDLQQKAAGFEQFFATHVPLRVELDPSASFGEALSTLKTRMALVKQRETYARDAVLRYPELGSLRANGDHSPLSVVVEQVECLDDYVTLPGSELTLLLAKDGTECRWIHDNAVLDKECITRMQRQFVSFLQNAVTDSNRPIAEISLLAESEHNQLMIEWNETQVDYPRHLCIHQLFEAQAEKTPDTVAVVFEKQQITYRQLNGRANQLAHHLHKLGVGPETPVGIYMGRSLDMIVGLLGILKAGGAYLPLDHTYPEDRIAFMVEDAKVPVLLTQARFVKNLPPNHAQLVSVDTDWNIISTESEENFHGGVIPDNMSYVIYTSGSTGKPKGVMVCHGNVVNFFTGMDEVIPHDPPGVWLAVTSLSFDISVLELLWTLARGFKLILYADKTRDKPLIKRDSLHTEIEFRELASPKKGAEDYSISTQINRHNVTHFQCTPSMASMLLMDDETRAALRSLQTFMIGGEALPVALATQLKQIVSGNVINMYGPTETTIWSSTYPVKDEQRTIPIGRPIANTEIYILDHNLQPVPVGVAGELLIGGDGVVRGYLNRPNLTSERFIEHPFSDKPGARLYRTGDLARYRPDGDIEFLGRIDHQVKIRGYRIELGEIETLLQQHPAVREAVVLSREDTPGDNRLVAYIIANQNQKLSSSELRDYMKQKLPEFMVPSHFVALDSFPLTPNRKIDRKALPAPGQVQIESQIPFVPPKNELEQTIANIWQELLNISKVGTNDNFFDLGGHSLLIVRAHRRLQEVIDRKLSITDMFRFPTIRTLTEYLSQDSDYGTQTIIQKSADRAKARRGAITRRRQRRQKIGYQYRPSAE
jgi:non-ribosomal peptide synthetase component F/methionyl-tRNA formyltransferase/acyl carrier protein